MTKTAARLNDDMAHAADEEAGFGALQTERGCLPLVAMEVEARIAGVHAETTVRQTFRNALDEPLEATYIFPLPDRAAVSKFELRVAGRTIVGDLKERGQAREEYDRAIEQGHRAAIAEEERSGVFTLRVGNLPPRETATIELTLVGPLPMADGEATFRFPLVVAPRYTPGVPLDGKSVGGGTTPDTDEVPDASRVTPPVLLPGFPNPVRLSFRVQLEPAASVADVAAWASQIRSSLHSTISDGTSPVVVRLQPGERLNRDFILRFPVAGKQLATSLAATPMQGDKAGVFALTLLPPQLAAGAARKPRDVAFVLDRSGSMKGWKMVAARRALGRMLDTLGDHDRFTLIAFDTAIEQPPHAQSLVAATNRERYRALEWLGKIDARGGTEMRPALVEAVRGLTDPQRERIVVLVTDGQVTGEDVIIRELSQLAGSKLPRVFTVGIDQAINAGFLQRLADLGHGACELVESEERLDAAMDRIHRLIATPVLTDVRLEPLNFDWVEKSLAPQRLGDLFADRPVTVFGRHLVAGAPLRLRIHGTGVDGKSWSDEVSAHASASSMLLNLWGRAKVRDLEDQYAAGQARDPSALAKEIVAVSLESHVLSRFTAYVAVDTAEVVNAGGEQAKILQPVEMPAGWAGRGGAPVFCMAPAAAAGSVLYSALQGAEGLMRKNRTRMARQQSDAPEMLRESRSKSADKPDMLSEDDDLLLGDMESLAASDPAGKLCDMLLKHAISQNASEIRLSPVGGAGRIELLIGGAWIELHAPPASLYPRLIEHLESRAQLDPAARHQVRRGLLVQRFSGWEARMAVASMPTSQGPVITIKMDAAAIAQAQGPAQGAGKRERFWS